MSILSVANVHFETTGTSRIDYIASNNLLRMVATGGVGIPSGNTAQRPTANVAGVIRYNTDYGALEAYDGRLSVWRSAAAAFGGGNNRVFFENESNVTANYSISTGFNAGSFGPITVNNGVEVTIPANSTWTVV